MKKESFIRSVLLFQRIDLLIKKNNGQAIVIVKYVKK